MKIIYIAAATNAEGTTVHENAYADAEQALAQATRMCEDINQNTGLGVHPEIIPIDFYEQGEVISNTISSES
jgi:hypothetical protein